MNLKEYKYKLTKLSDDVFEGKHPNDITEGMQWFSDLDLKPTVGQRFCFGPKEKFDKYNHIWTSTVMEILEDGVFKTRNSTYKIEKFK